MQFNPKECQQFNNSTSPWINLSQVCMLLYGKKDSSTRAYFALKRKNKRPWKEGELQKLESIRQQLMEEMAAS